MTKRRPKMLRKIEDCAPDPQNPNRGTKRGLDLLETSLEKFGAVRSIAVDKNGVTIAGAKTLQSAVEKGLPIEVVRSDGRKLVVVQRTDLDMNEPMAQAAGIADNRVAEVGLEWDSEMLTRLKNEGVEVSDFWFDDEFAKAFGGNGDAPPDPGADIDKAAALLKKWKVKRGQVWEIGRHRVMCGDATSEDAAALRDDAQPEVVVTDPPYGVSLGTTNWNPKQRMPRKVENDDLRGQEIESFVAASVKPWLCPGVSVYCWAASLNPGASSLRGLLAAGVHVQSQIVWVKPSLVLGQADYQWRHEVCWYGFVKGKRRRPWSGGRTQTTVWETSRENTEPHPTQKPVELAAIAIRNSSTSGGVVADPFLGSGTTAVAAEQLGRACYGMDIEPEYVAVALERLAGMGLKPKRVSG